LKLSQPLTCCRAQQQRPQTHYPVDPPGASFLQTSDIRKLCEVPSPFWLPSSPSEVHPTTLHDEGPHYRGACLARVVPDLAVPDLRCRPRSQAGGLSERSRR
jgi:hypothetical protein